MLKHMETKQKHLKKVNSIRGGAVFELYCVGGGNRIQLTHDYFTGHMQRMCLVIPLIHKGGTIPANGEG